MPRTLLLLRHAKSSWAETGLSDHERPLNSRGERDAPRVGELARELELVPDQIFVSTALRARETAELFARASGFDGATETREELYLSPPDTILREASSGADSTSTLLVIAHNPGMEELTSILAGRLEPFPTGALSAFEFEITSWSELDGSTVARTIGVWRPKEL